MAAVKANDLLAKLRAALAGEADEVPDKHRTKSQWAEFWGLSESTAERLLRAGITKGIMARKNYRVANDSGQVKPVPHYYEL